MEPPKAEAQNAQSGNDERIDPVDASVVLPPLHERLQALGLVPVAPDEQLTASLKPMLAATPMFSGLSAEQLARVAAAISIYDASVGITLITEGEQGDFLMLLMAGAVDVLRRNRNNYPARIAVVNAGQMLGEMSMFDGDPRFSSCVTLEPTRCAVLAHESLMQLFEQDPQLGNLVMIELVKLLSERLRQTSSTLVSYLDTARSG